MPRGLCFSAVFDPDPPRCSVTCTEDHRVPCWYSTACHKRQQADHDTRYYHPHGTCAAGHECTDVSPAHAINWSHPCMKCGAPTIATGGGWLCGWHRKQEPSSSENDDDGDAESTDILGDHLFC